MKKLLSIMLAVILFMININIAFPVSAAVDNSHYIPKVVGTKDGNKLIFDSEIAEIARKMSLDAYGIKDGANATAVAKTMASEEFKDIQIIKNEDEKNGDLPLSFLVGVKTFNYNGTKKHILAITFRGTTFNLNEIVADLLYVDLNGFHSGFYGSACNAFNELGSRKITFPSLNNMSFSDYREKCKDGNDDYYILVTGHSLGGAIANIFTGDVLAGFGVKRNVQCYTFAAPLVCSKNTANKINAYNIFNFVNNNDVVPKVGYDITKGIRMGIDFTGSAKSTDGKIPNHSITTAYKNVTQQVINNIDSLYTYTTSFYNKWSNNKNEGNGGHIHNYYYNNGKCYCGEGKNTATKTDNKSTLNINLTSYPTSIKQGSFFGLRGTISSNYDIKKVSGYIMQGNTIYISSEDLPNKKNLDVKTASLNKSLNFGILPVGNYSLYVEAVDTSGQTVRVSKNFSVYDEQKKDASTLSINLERYPVSIDLGSAYSVRGNISSNYSISKVRGYIYDANGSVVQSTTDTPNSTYMEIRPANLNQKLIFNKLSSGNYTMKVEAVDASGKVVTATKNFTVKGGGNTPSGAPIKFEIETVPKGNLPYGKDFTLKGWFRSDSAIAETRAYILDENKNVVMQSDSASSTTGNYKIEGYKLDKGIKFDQLSPGGYYLKYYVRDADGDTSTWMSDKFYIVKENTSSGSSPSTPSTNNSQTTSIRFEIESMPKGNLPYGKSFSLKGWFRSDSPIVEARAYMLDANKNIVMQSDPASSTTSNYKIQGYKLDKAMKFDKLSPGGYYLKFFVRDANGDTFTWVSDKFYIVK